MTDRTRRGGCGCLAVLLVLLVPLLLVGTLFRAVDGVTEGIPAGAGVVALAGLVLLAGTVLALVGWSRRRREEEQEAASRAAGPSPRSQRSAPPVPPRRTEREVRSGARRLSTQPDTEEARTLKQRLTEAVSDLADNVEEMPERTDQRVDRRLTSDEMIARAKQRIRDRAEDPDL